MATIKVRGHTRNINGNPKRWIEHDRIIVKKKASNGNTNNNNLISDDNKVKEINKWYASKNYERDKQNLINWINTINQQSIVPIKTTNYDWFSSYVAKHQDDLIFMVLSDYDRESLKHFELPKQGIDPSELIAMVNINFLVNHKGNQYSDYKTKTVDSVIERGLKFNSLPIFNVKRGRVDEGNHRVRKMQQMGYKTCPVHIMWK